MATPEYASVFLRKALFIASCIPITFSLTQ